MPWDRRREWGQIRTFILTTWMATTDPARLARLMAWPVDVRAARRFRRITIAAIVLVASFTFFKIVRPTIDFTVNTTPVDRSQTTYVFSTFDFASHCWWLGMAWAVVPPLGLTVALLVGTRWDHWFAIHELTPIVQGRVIAGGWYLVAPLIGTAAVAIAMTWINWATGGWLPKQWRVIVPLAEMLAIGLTTCCVIAAPVNYAGALPAVGPRRKALTLVGIAAQWLVAATVGLALLPAAVGLLELVIEPPR